MSKIRQRNYYCAGCQQSENYKDSSAQNRLEIWNKRVVLTHCTYYVGEWNTFSKIFMFRWWNKYLHTWVFLLFMIQLLTVIKWTVKLTQVKKKHFLKLQLICKTKSQWKDCISSHMTCYSVYTGYCPDDFRWLCIFTQDATGFTAAG